MWRWKDAGDGLILIRPCRVSADAAVALAPHLVSYIILKSAT